MTIAPGIRPKTNAPAPGASRSAGRGQGGERCDDVGVRLPSRLQYREHILRTARSGAYRPATAAASARGTAGGRTSYASEEMYVMIRGGRPS